MEIDLKRQREQDYHNKFLNRGKSGRSRQYRKVKLGNSLSITASRPAGQPAVSSRVVTAMENRDTSQLTITDYSLIGQKLRKTTIPGAIPHNPRCKLNKQVPIRVKTKLKLQPRFVELPRIRNKLYLGNSAVLMSNDCLEQIRPDVIINLSSETSIQSTDVCRCHNILMEDTKLPFGKFFSVYSNVEEILKECGPNLTILVVCRKGVNRSVAMLAGYAIRALKFSYWDTLLYIQGAKEAKYGEVWVSLNNMHFRSLLYCMMISTK